MQVCVRDLPSQSTLLSLLDFMALTTTASTSCQGKKEKDKIIKAIRLALEDSSSCCYEWPRQWTIDLLGVILPAQEQRQKKDTINRTQRASADPLMLLLKGLEFLC